MPKASWSQTNFNAGEWSPLTFGRADIAKYKNALETCLNYIPTVQGGLTRRSGTRYVAEVKDSTKRVRLQRFEFSITQAYVLEFGPSYIRFYLNDGQLISGTPYEVATPYAEVDLFNLSFAQSADVLYIAHPSYAPRKLQRLGATSWTLTTISFLDGPYLIPNSSATTFTSTAATGATTLTASAATFAASDVGRLVRLKSGTNWGWGTITAFTSTTVVSVTWTTTVGTTATTTWRLGVMGTANGYPSTVTFHEDRLVWGGYAQYPQRLDGSNSSDYENMSPSGIDGVIVASNAISFSLNSNTVNSIRWMMSEERGLLVGTAGGEWIVRSSSLQEAISPTNVQAKQSTQFGSNAVQAIKVGKATIFVQRSGKKVRELAYVFTVDGFQAPDISLLSEHLLNPAVTQLAVQYTPQQIIWAVRSDGSLIGCTYERDQEVVGWHDHTIGGYYNSGKTLPAKVESVACIPNSDGSRDEVWMVVNRNINGVNKRYVEYMSKLWESGDVIDDGVFVDSSALYSGASTTTISGLGYLEGQTVSVLANGAVHPDVVVTAGVITLSYAVTKAQVGLGYNSDGKTMRIEAGAADGTAQGKYKRIHRVIFRLFQSVGLNVQANGNGQYMIPEPFRSSADPMDHSVSLFTGDKRWAWEGGYETEGQVFWRQNQPLPSNILSITVQLETQDGG